MFKTTLLPRTSGVAIMQL